jgi:MFS family permease
VRRHDAVHSARALSTSAASAPAPLPKPPDDPRLARSLEMSVWEGMAAEVVTMSAGGAVLTAWALHFHAGPFLLGLLASLNYVAQLVQFPSAYLTQRFGGRAVALWAVAASRQALWPLVFLPFLPIDDRAAKGVLFAVAAVSALLAIVGNNGWNTWMGDLVPGTIRGRYFGRRTAICTLASGASGLGAGLWLDFMRGRGLEAEALSALGLVAVAVGALSTWLMRQQHDPGHHASAKVDWHAMVAPLREPAMRRLLAYILPWNVGVGLSSSLFAPFMLGELGMGYAMMALREATTAGLRIVVSPLWGRAIDRVGSRPVLVACSFTIVAIPFLWMLAAPDRLWPVFADSLMAGVLWSGHNLATMQMPIALAPRQGRSWHVAAFYACAGLAFATGAVAGGWVANRLPAFVPVGQGALTRFQVVLLGSACFRLGGAFLSLKTREPGAKGVRELARLVGDRARGRAGAPAAAE